MNFSNFKKDTNEIFKKLIDSFVSLYDLTKRKDDGNPILREFSIFQEVENMKEICENLKINIGIISRDQMKCVFFGKTSNGKSATINAILGEEVLPSNIGRTTSCFITIEGCNESSGYILDGNNKKRTIKDINDIASELDAASFDVSSEIKLFWPRDRCDFLQSEIRLLDSPGVDYSPRNNKWIESYCQDADVFVYVVDAGSTINESERLFFRRVKYLLKTPNIIILMNKWDQCVKNKNESEVKKLREQHEETSRKFLREDLKLSYNTNERIFFVSATEALECAGFNEAAPELGEFNDFVRFLQEELSNNAIITKFKPHIIKGIEYIDQTLRVLDTMLSTASHKDSELQKSALELKIEGLITDAFDKIQKTSSEKVDSQYSLMAPSFARGQKPDYYNQIALEYSQNIIIIVLQDTFKRNIEELSLRMKDEFMKCCQYKIPIEYLDEYRDLTFTDYIRTFEKKVPIEVHKTTSMLQMPPPKEEINEEDGLNSKNISAIASIILTNVIKYKSETPQTLSMTAIAIVEGIKETLAKEKPEVKKPEVREIPEHYLKQLITQSLMQFVNKAKEDIQRNAIKTTNQYKKDLIELHRTMHDVEMIRKRMLEIKEKLENSKKYLDEVIP